MCSEPNSISAAELEIVDIETGTDGDDPFATFSEWASEADEQAYASL